MVEPLADVLEQNVLTLYFNRKSEDIIRRQIPAFTSNIFFYLCSTIAMECIRRDNSIPREMLANIVKECVPFLTSVTDEVILALISEQIFHRDPINSNLINFKHSRFIEYLVAWFIVHDATEYRDHSRLDKLTNDVFESNIASMYRVHDLIRYICGKNYPDLLDFIADFYAASHLYMSSILRFLRSAIAGGAQTKGI